MTSEIEDVKEIITKSGNSFHCKVLKYLQDKGWTILISPYYNDNLSGKPREIDLIAEKRFPIPNQYPPDPGDVSVRLFIECKYIPQKTVFWFHDKDTEKTNQLIKSTSPCRLDNTFTKNHHYLIYSRVAKLFADEKSKSADNEIFFKALNQSLNALLAYRNKKSIIPIPTGRKDYTKLILNYPIISCNSFENLYRVDIDNDNDPINIKNNFQLEVNYAYTTRDSIDANEFFLIDIIDFNQLDQFLELLEMDAKVSSFFLSNN